jgi:nucleoside-diphosphate-sugar epimerase
MIFGSGELKEKFLTLSKGRDIDLAIYAHHSKKILYTETFFNAQCKQLKENSESIKLIYFSSLSLYDTSLANDPYVLFQKRTENWIQSNLENYNIFRLPILVGDLNENNLISYIHNCIIEDKTINIFNNATRYIMDIDDVIDFVFNNFTRENKIINMYISKPISIHNIITCLSELINKSVNIKLLNEGYSYHLPIIDYPNYKIYLMKTLSKYYNTQAK